MLKAFLMYKLLISVVISQLLFARSACADGPGITGSGNLTGFTLNKAQIESIAREALVPGFSNPILGGLILRLKLYQELIEKDASISSETVYIGLMKIYLGASVKEGRSFENLPVIFQDHLRVDNDKPCLDNNKTPWDGGFSRVDGKSEICLSAPRIISEIKSHDSTIKISALVYHEIAHAYGATEVEAIAIQDLVETILSPTLLKTQKVAEYRTVSLNCSFNYSHLPEKLKNINKTFKLPYEGASQIFEFGERNQMRFSILVSRDLNGKPFPDPMVTFSEKGPEGWDDVMMFMTSGKLHYSRKRADQHYLNITCSKL
jgi:hypothetical protein